MYTRGKLRKLGIIAFSTAYPCKELPSGDSQQTSHVSDRLLSFFFLTLQLLRLRNWKKGGEEVKLISRVHSFSISCYYLIRYLAVILQYLNGAIIATQPVRSNCLQFSTTVSQKVSNPTHSFLRLCI